MNIELAYQLLVCAGKRDIINEYGQEVYVAIKKISDAKLKEILPKIPKLKNSHFDFNYKFIVAYVPIYYAFKQFDETTDNADRLLWMMNEELLRKIPRYIWRLIGRLSLNKSLKKKQKALQKSGEEGLLDPLDFRIQVIECDDGSYFCNFVECGAYKVLKMIGEDYIFPSACRIDYLVANLSGLKFERNKTIADGDDCCNNHIMGCGYTEWSPENGFIDRK